MTGSPVSRITDVGVGICCCHPPIPCIGMVGVIITGANKTNVENQPVSRIGDIVIGNCGHIGIINTGSSTVLTENSSTARVGDSFSGCFTGTIITGAETVKCS